MSGFKALNVDSESEEEIDDTKELQLEDAFKLYGTALKLHSQGPAHYDEAEDAYNELFQSEVFKYPEAISEFAHDQDDEPNHPVIQPEAEADSIIPANAADTSANSIPLLVYLSYKNKGQLAIDRAHDQAPSRSASRKELARHFAPSCNAALADFAEALERDDTDIDLWKKAARVAEILSTQRITRFCMESVLAGDDDGTEQTVDLSGLDEAFAAGELRKITTLLQDDLTRVRSSNVFPKEPLLALLSKSSDPYPFLPSRSGQLEYLDDHRRPDDLHVDQILLKSTTIASLGQEILQMLINHQQGNGCLSAHTILSVDQAAMKQNTSQIDKEVFVDAEEVLRPTTNGVTSGNEPFEIRDSPEKIDTGDRTNDMAIEDGDDGAATITVEPTCGAYIDLPTRKRSATAAGHEEPEGRIKSKRLRARESMIEAPIEEENNAQEVVLKEPWDWTVLQNADKEQIKVLDSFLSRLGIPTFGPLEEIKTGSGGSSTPIPRNRPPKKLLASDLTKALRSWTDEHSQATLFGHGNQDFVEKSTGLALFLQHTKTAAEAEIELSASGVGDELSSFCTHLVSHPSTLYDTTFEWLLSILAPSGGKDSSNSSYYLREAWTDDVKQTVVQLLLRSDEYLLDTLGQQYQTFAVDRAKAGDDTKALTHWKLSQLMELVQSIFELHLDIYSRITNPSSQVDRDVRIKEADSLERWAGLADEFMRIYAEINADSSISDTLVIRFLWSSTLYAGHGEGVDQNHMMLCLEDLKRVLKKLQVKPVLLPNNAAMPQISVSAVEQEIQRLSTLDFFLSIFDDDDSEPIAIIEKLEPILELDLAQQSEPDDQSQHVSDHAQKAVLDFLDSGDASLKLFLWRRLQNAYITISYVPKVVSCLLRTVETIARELCSNRHAQLEDHTRQVVMLKWLRDLDEILIRALSKILNESNALECLDEAHLRSSLTAVSFLLRLVHTFALYEDNIRFQYSTPPQFKGATSAKNFEKSRDRLREIQVRLWILQYFLLKEATEQHQDVFPDKANDLADYLCTVHFALGQRLYCKQSNKQFVKLVKAELQSLKTTNDYSADMAQVLFDLYQMKFVIGEGDFDHGCPTETLDKKTALSLIPLVMFYARRVNIKDLIKSDLRITIEKVQAASGKTVSPPAALHNRKVINAYLKSPIIPEDLFRAAKGLGGLPTKPVLGEGSVKSTHGWFFLLGHITLAKYRSVKRVSPTPTDDLDVAATLLRQDLEFDMEKWETWFRLAQIFEAKIEDDLIWNSTKLNEARGDIAQLERHSIHAFTMATTLAMRSGDDDAESRQKIAELHLEFAMRLYASSREPLSMEAFNTDKTMRHISNSHDGRMSKTPFHQPLSKYALWHFAAYLLRRKFSDKPKLWTSHYTLGKCLWKMFESEENMTKRRPVRAEEVVEAFADAIEAVPKKERSSEYILEPHFKLVSIVHKMVHRRHIKAQTGRDWLQATRFAHGVHLAVDEDGDPDWERYVLNILKKLSNADKQHWHHRIIARAAHVIYDGQPTVGGALGAKHEFTQQIFTKTMTYQVWKPEFERPGRHYVYTGRYVLFFAHLLDKLNDRSNLDQLVRRVRRKQTDFIDHEKIWGTIATTYVNLLRRSAKIPEGRERAVFDSISYDNFTKNSEKLERWALDEDTTSIVLDVMRDGVELKKINNSLLKGGVIDDLIGDAYACMYEAFVAQLPPEEQKPQPPFMPQGAFFNMTVNGVPGHDGSSDQRSATGEAPPPNAGLEALSSTSEVPQVQSHIGLGLQTPTHQFVGDPSSLPNAFVEPPRPIVEKAKPGRAKTITRREIQRKAEAVLVKPPPIKTPTLMKRPVVEIPVAIAEPDSPAPGRVEDLRNEKDEGQESMLSSRRGSFQSSVAGEVREGSVDAGEEGDDESELSDGEENEHEGDGDDGDDDAGEVSLKPFFPGLVSNREGDTHGSDADDDDEDDENDMEGGEEEDEERAEGHDPKISAGGGYDRMQVDDVEQDQGVEIQDSQEGL